MLVMTSLYLLYNAFIYETLVKIVVITILLIIKKLMIDCVTSC